MSSYQAELLGANPYDSQQFSPRIFERDYVEGVLGIKLPLNESSPYSAHYRQQIIEEQLQLEGFFKDFKKLGGQMKDAALALRFVFEEPSRIKEFVDLVISEVNETYDKFMKWAQKLLKILKNIAKSYSNKAMQTIGQFIEKLKDGMEKVWEQTKGMDGWKKALFAIFASVSIRYIWDQITDAGADEQSDEEKAKEIMAALGGTDEEIAKLGESIAYQSPSLMTALYHTDTDERLDEFMKSLKKLGKKAKDTFSKGKKDAKKVGDQLDKNKSGKKLKKAAKDKADELKGDAKEKAKEALSGGDDDDSGDESSGESEKEAKEKAKKETEEFLKPLKQLAKNLGKGFMKSMAIDAVAGALTGGVATAFKYMAKAFKGIKYVFKVVGGPLGKFVGQIKNQKEEAKEAEEGKDDPTDPETQKEAHLRAYIGEILRSEGA